VIKSNEIDFGTNPQLQLFLAVRMNKKEKCSEQLIRLN
jgi:hypothetical protein